MHYEYRVHTNYPHQHQHVLYNDFKNTHHAHFTFTLQMYFAISARDTHTEIFDRSAVPWRNTVGVAQAPHVRLS